MRPTIPALLALLLPACGSLTAREPARTESAEAAACRAEARGSDAVEDINRRANWLNEDYTERLRAERAQAQNVAVNDCLRRRGVIRGGGVQAVRPAGR